MYYNNTYIYIYIYYFFTFEASRYLRPREEHTIFFNNSSIVSTHLRQEFGGFFGTIWKKLHVKRRRGGSDSAQTNGYAVVPDPDKRFYRVFNIATRNNNNNNIITDVCCVLVLASWNIIYFIPCDCECIRCTRDTSECARFKKWFMTGTRVLRQYESIICAGTYTFTMIII